MALLILITAIMLAMYNWGIWQALRLPSVYWLFILGGTATGRLSFFYIPLLFIILMIWATLVGRSRKSSLYWSIIGIVLFALVMMCVATLPVMLGAYRHHDTVWLAGHTYYVGSAWKVGVGGSYPSVFLLYDCDTIGLFCEVIHDVEYRGTPLDEFEQMTAHLLPDSTTNTIALEINGKVVYRHQVPE